MTAFPDHLELMVEMAFGADPDGDPDEWTFTDVSSALLNPPITITRGRSDESADVDASSVSFVLDNNPGDFTPDSPLSQYWPHVKLRTPCRISVANLPAELGGPDLAIRMCGFVSEWAPEWPEGDHSGGEPGEGHAVVNVTVNGILHPLQQGDEPVSSALMRATTRRDDVVAYWPCEDGSSATGAASPIRNVPPMQAVGVEFGAGDDVPPGSEPGLMRILPEAVNVIGQVPAVTASQWLVSALFRVNEIGGTDFRTAMTVQTTGTVQLWRIRFSNNQVQLRGVDMDDTAVVTSTQTMGQFLGRWVFITLSLTQNGTAIDWAWSIRHATPAFTNVNGTSGSLASSTVGRVSRAGAFVGAAAPDVPERWIGHVTVLRGTDAAPVYDTAAIHGYTGEKAGDRFLRLCEEEGRHCQVVGDAADTMPMGPQLIDTLVANLRDCANTDRGILFEFHEFGLALRTRASMYNQDPKLELDASAGFGEIDHPFAPVLDDQDVRNDVTVERTGGSSVRLVDEQHRAEHGHFPDGLTINVDTDDRIEQVASWHLHVGTWPGKRYRSLSPALNQVPEVIADWLHVDIGDRVQVTGLPPQHPSDTVDLLVQGYSETLDPQGWTAEANCTPAAPWSSLFTVEDDTLGRLESDAYLAQDVDDDDTSFDVVVPVRRALNPDSDFEFDFATVTDLDMSAWRTFDLASFTRSTEHAFRGRSSGRAVPDGAHSDAEVQTLALAGSGPSAYTGTAWLRAPSGTVEARLIMRFRTTAGVVLPPPNDVHTTSFVTVSSSGWTRLHLLGAPHVRAGRVQLSVEFRRLGGGTLLASDVLFVDDAEIGVQGQPFTTDSGDLPFGVNIGGERMVATAVSAVTSGALQQLTVTRGDPAKAHPAGTDVRLSPSPVLAL